MELPFVDEHRVVVTASPAEVWRVLVDRIQRSLAAPSWLAGVLGTEPRHATGTPFGQGSSVPGFAVDEVVPERLIRLTGRHRFSRYELVFTVDKWAGGTLLKARTRAAFPGLAGGLYRKLVIDSGAHRVLTKRLLASISRSVPAAGEWPPP